MNRLQAIVDIKPISEYRAPLHNKYVIADGLAAEAAIVTGSTNFTNDAWGLQENRVVMSSGPFLSAVSETIDRGIGVAGLYDGPQMDTILRQWTEAHVGEDKIAAWKPGQQGIEPLWPGCAAQLHA